MQGWHLFLARLTDAQSGYSTLLLVLMVLLLVALLHKAWALLYSRLTTRFSTTTNLWDDALLKALHHPVAVAIWLMGLAFVSRAFLMELTAEQKVIWSTALEVCYLLLLAWFLLRLVRRLEQAWLQSPTNKQLKLARSNVDVIAKVLQLLIFVSFALVILQAVGVRITGLLAVGGASSIILGLAAKDLLSNLFGGVIVYVDRPFNVGDWIASPDRQIEGTVEKISWRMTQIRTFDKRPLYVPNSVFTTISIQNPSRMTNRRIKETMGLRYQDIGKMAAILADIEAMLRNHPEIDSRQTLMVRFNSYGPSSVDFFIYTFTKTTAWVKFHEIKQDVLLQIADIVDKQGAEFAFPSSTVYLPDPIRLVNQSEGVNHEH